MDGAMIVRRFAGLVAGVALTVGCGSETEGGSGGGGGAGGADATSGTSGGEGGGSQAAWLVDYAGDRTGSVGGNITTVVSSNLGSSVSRSIAGGSPAGPKMSGSFSLPADGSITATRFLSFSVTLDDGTECPASSSSIVDVRMLSTDPEPLRVEFDGVLDCAGESLDIEGYLNE